MANPSNGNSGLSWVPIAALVTIIGVLFGGSWTVSQNQFGYVEKDKEILRQQLVKSQSDVQAQFKQVVEQVEFKQFEYRMDAQIAEIQQRIALIEQTRPSAGELKGVADSANQQINRILDRLDRLERTPGISSKAQ